MERLEQRMYFLNNFYFMGIQAGIQAGHAALLYARQYGDSEAFKDFVDYDGTWIVLVGGFHNEMEGFDNPAWGMNYAYRQLKNNNIPFADFYEKMANSCMSSLAFLVNEKVWNKVKYPDPKRWTEDEQGERQIYYKEVLGLNDKEVFLRLFLEQYPLAK